MKIKSKMNATGGSFSEKEAERIRNAGAFGYGAESVAMLLGVDTAWVAKSLKDTTSELYRLYNAGRVFAEYSIDLKLFELARNGDLKALEDFQFRKESRK